MTVQLVKVEVVDRNFSVPVECFKCGEDFSYGYQLENTYEDDFATYVTQGFYACPSCHGFDSNA